MSSWGSFFHPPPAGCFGVSLTLCRTSPGMSIIHRRDAYTMGMSALWIEDTGIRARYSRAVSMLGQGLGEFGLGPSTI